MITDIQELIFLCEQELKDRGYRQPHASSIKAEWKAAAVWFSARSLSFTQKTCEQYCDQVIGGHLLTPEMNVSERLQLRALRMLLSYQQDGDFEFRSPRVERIFEGETGNIIEEYLRFELSRGLSPKTVDLKRMALHDFNCFLIKEKMDFTAVDLVAIEAFFSSRQYSPASRHNNASHIRQLFHYMFEKGYSDKDMAIYVLADNYNSSRKLATTYSEEEISRLIAAVERSSSTGKRDYLILLLAAEYGWRAGDIVNFRFNQINWEKNTICFTQDKTKVLVEFPLLASVGNAIIDYLEYARPKTDAPEIIVSAMSSTLGKPLKPPTIHSIVARYMAIAKISNWKEKKHGPHALRHSLATNMLQKNISLPIISTVLGHQNTSSTKVYLKVDEAKLALCTLPIPKLKSPLYKEVTQ